MQQSRMETTRYTLTLPTDLAQAIEDQVKAGAYASVSDAVVASLRNLLDQDASLERWLQDEVGRRYDAYLADPATVVGAADVVERAEARYLAAKATPAR
jgi:antitoxin ParD1/3/4